jgi:hypothetical protein
MAFTPYPPIDTTASSRNENLEGNPTGLVDGIEFFLEMQTLLTGKNDIVKRHSAPPNPPEGRIERNWQITTPPALQIQDTNQPRVTSHSTDGTPPATGNLPAGGKK